MRANSILIFILMSLTVLNLNSCKYRPNFTETLATQDTKSTLVSQEYFEIGPLNGRKATPEELSSFAEQIHTHDLAKEDIYFRLTNPISPLAVGLVVYQLLEDLNPLQMRSVVKAQLIKIEEKNGTTEKTLKISNSLYFKSTLPTYLHIDDSKIGKYDAQRQKFDELLPNAKCYLNFILFPTPRTCQDISLFFKSISNTAGIFLVDVPTLGVRAVKGLLQQYDEDHKFVFIKDPNTQLEYKTTSRKIVAFYEGKVPTLRTTPSTDLKSNKEIKTKDAIDQDLEKKSSRSHSSEWLKGDVDFMVGPYLIGKSYVYHNADKGVFTPDEVDVLGFKSARIKIRIKSSGVIKFADRDTIYIHRKNTTLGREQEIFNNFLTQCKAAKSIDCYVKKDLVSLLDNSSVKAETKEFTDFPTPSLITSMTGVWLINIGLGYEIITGSTAKTNRTFQINTSSSAAYNLFNKNILAYFVTSSSAGQWLRGQEDFNVGKHLIGRSGIYRNTKNNTFEPELVDFLGTKAGLAVILVPGEKEPKIVSPAALYIQRENTALGKEQEILGDFLTQCKSNMAKNCYLKKGIQLSLKSNEKNLKIKYFTRLPTIEINSAPTTRFWLVDMGLGYEIITGNAKRTPKYLEILTPTGIAYKLKEKELIGYFLK